MAGSVVLVTGAASGVGHAATGMFTEAGAAVWATDLNQIETAGSWRDVSLRHGDVGDEAFVRSLARQVAGQAGRVDAIVHCAGVYSGVALADCDIDAWERTVRTNLTSGFLLLKHVHPALTRSDHASVTLVGSVAGINGGDGCGPAYAASKAGLHGLAKWAARRLAADRIRVNVIAPGPLDTPMSWGLGLVGERVPLGRLGRPDEIAAAAFFLASARADWITGQVISPNGGTLIS
jgi:NAD(P)-dependent dehydrogenase (short-subunit alcohol dehydrogenase family)